VAHFLDKRGDTPVVAFGPEAPGWGSWHWLGDDLRDELSSAFRTTSFRDGPPPEADVVVVVKHAPPPEWVERAARRSAVVYCPVDYYPSAAAVAADAALLRLCSRIVVHCERLRRYFEPYAPVEYLDHHVKFAAAPRESAPPDGPVLWVGVRTNLPPLVDWVNRHPPPGELWVLTNPEDLSRPPGPAELGFRRPGAVRVGVWTPERHREWAAVARAALDVKGDDFRSRHKPPAKAIDFIASGVPLAMNPDSSPAEHLARLGFEVPSPLDTGRWLSREYREETRRFGRALGELLSLRRVGVRFRKIIEGVLAGRRGTPRSRPGGCEAREG
jgi:hypothetical protein